MENILYIWTYFIIYSIAGWVLESVFRSICEKKIINTGFLKGPFCPIYGIGAMIMFLFLETFKENEFILFIVSFVVLSLWEYVVGVWLEKVFKTKYWDYSNHKINIKGRVCLFNSLCWGILGVLFIKFIHPNVEQVLKLINPVYLIIIISIITIIFIIDTIISIKQVKNIRNILQKIEDLNNQIKEKAEEIKNLKANKYKEEIIENIQNSIELLRKRKDKILKNIYKRVNRLKKAFPQIDSEEIAEILSKKLEIKIRMNKRRKHDK